MPRICLLTPGQPSLNPRLTKEADALVEAGYTVQVICGHYIDWADKADESLLRSRRWSCAYVGGEPATSPVSYALTRLRYAGSRRVLSAWRRMIPLRRWAISRILPELTAAAKRTPADLYIGHYLAGLLAGAVAAQKHKARLGYDAEDFEPGHRPLGAVHSATEELTEIFEREYLPKCDYITAASPGIAQAYATKYGLPMPLTILNVFPLSQRPSALKVSTNRAPLRLYWFSQTIGPHRGLEDVVRAMGMLEGDKTELHLRGRWAAGYRDSLLPLAESCGVPLENIVSHPPSSPDEMIRLASEYDVGLSLDQHISENREVCISNKLFTYLLAGNAVIATATRGQRPIMETLGPAGFCYEPGDIASLAHCLRGWFDNRASLNISRRHAWDWGTIRYNWDTEKTKFLDLVSRTLLRGKS